MKIFRLSLNIILLFICSTVNASNSNAESSGVELIKTMQSKGHILMIRHALAPGFGDPDNIKIGDCNTQRNLDETGRRQSKQIGAWLKHNQITPSAIYSSQWCRCKETAELLDLGSVEELSGLNSFFQMTENREPNLRALNQFIAKQAIDENLIIMVTHSVTISAISGKHVASGDGILLKLYDDKPFDVVTVVKTNALE